MATCDRQYVAKSKAPSRAELSSGRLLAVWFMIGIAVATGVVLRFNKLSQQGYFADEYVSSLFVSGFPSDKASRTAHIPQDVLKYEHLARNTSVATVVEHLSQNCADQTPCYYIFCRLWSQIAGNDCSAEALRPVSVFFGLLLIPAMYCLCVELFGTSLAGGLGAAVVALSPFHLIWSQHARPYVLWSLLIVLSLIALLRASRLGGFRNWSLYVVCATAAIYTHILSLFVLFGQALSIILISRFKLGKNVAAPYFASLACVIALAWHWKQFLKEGHYCAVVSWMGRKEPLNSLIGHFSENISTAFVTRGLLPLQMGDLAEIVVIALLLCSIYHLVATARKFTTVHIVALIAVPTLCLICKDVDNAIRHGITITSSTMVEGNLVCMVVRYLTPALIGFQLAIVYLAADYLRCNKGFTIAVSFLAIFLFLAAGSCLSVGERLNPDLKSMAQSINTSDIDPVLIKSSGALVFPLCRHLRDDVKLVGMEPGGLMETVERYRRVFVFSTRSQLRDVINSGRFECKRCQPGGKLWQLTAVEGSAPQAVSPAN